MTADSHPGARRPATPLPGAPSEEGAVLRLLGTGLGLLGAGAALLLTSRPPRGRAQPVSAPSSRR